MAGRPRRSLWKRPYSSYRVGDRRRPEAGDDLQRLTLFLTGTLLDHAEKMTVRTGAKSVQSYCENLLTQALQAELSREQVKDAEAKHGPFKGFREITDDPEYLAEWEASSHKDSHQSFALRARSGESPALSLSAPAQSIVRHAGLSDDPLGLIACLRRGESPPSNTMIEVALALSELSTALAGAPLIDRRLAHALHRLAFESQVLLTDAWPDAFDTMTIQCIRDVQEAADVILSGIRPEIDDASSID